MEMGGFKIASIRGIPIRIHITFLLVLPLLAFGFARAFTEAARLADVPAERIMGSPFLWGLGMALFLFLSVLVHELAHSLYALQKGGKVHGITLLMIGGVSQMSEPPKEAKHEAVMALVGPLVSLALGGMLYALHLAVSASFFGLRFGLFYLASVNLFLGLFNLLPAFPMDGGRILRALLVRKVGMVKATRIAATVGKGFAVLFGIWGLVSFNLLLLLIAFFVFVGAEGETRAVLMKAAIGKLRVSDLMSAEVLTIPATASVHDAAERMLRERRLAFVVADGGQARGLITLEGVYSVPLEKRMETPVTAVATEAAPLSPEDDAVKALQRMAETNAPQLAVAVDGRLVGMVSRDDILRALKLSELEATQRSRPRWPASPRREARV